VPFCAVHVKTTTRAADSEKYALVYSIFTLHVRFGVEEIDPDPELFQSGSGAVFTVGRPDEGAGAIWGTQYFDAVPGEVTIKVPDDARFTPGAVGASAQFWRLSEDEWSPTTDVLTKTLEIQ